MEEDTLKKYGATDDLIKCEKCGTDNVITRSNCRNCGKPLLKTNNTVKLIKCEVCGKEIAENAVSCPNCGAKNKNNSDTASTGTVIICFLIPIIGLIIYAVNISTRPKYANECLTASLLPIILAVIIITVMIVYTTSSIPSSTSDITQNSQYCAKSGCTNVRASGSIYCYLHQSSSSSSSSSSLPYCKYSGCLNRVPYSWREYCDVHKYME